MLRPSSPRLLLLLPTVTYRTVALVDAARRRGARQAPAATAARDGRCGRSSLRAPHDRGGPGEGRERRLVPLRVEAVAAVRVARRDPRRYAGRIRGSVRTHQEDPRANGMRPL